MTAKFADSKCAHCEANLPRRKTPEKLLVVTPRAGEPDFGQRLYAPCPACEVYLPVVGETSEAEATEAEPAEAEPTGPEPTE